MALCAACATSATTTDFGGNGVTRDASGDSSADAGSSSNSSGDDSGGSSSGGGTSSGGNANGGGSSSGGGTPMSDSDCQAMTGNMCLGCCQQLHAPGPMTLFNAIQACVCGDAGVCASSCATEYCQMAGKITSMNDPCAQCILNDVAPDAGCGSVNGTCQADSNCCAYVTCAQGCPQ